MPVVTSTAYRKWVKEYDSEDPMILLIEISYNTLAEPVRISSDMTKFLQFDPMTQEPIYGTVHKGKNYYAYPFAFTLPDQPEGSDTTTKAQFRVDNISRDLTQTIRDLQLAPVLKLFFVYGSNLEEVVLELPELNIVDINYTPSTITCDLAAADFRLEAFPGTQFYPSRFPGLFS